MTPEEAREEILACVEGEGGFPGSDVLDVAHQPSLIRFRWPTGAWFVYAAVGATVATDAEWTPIADDAPWPKAAVDGYVEGGGRLRGDQLKAYRARLCYLHGESFERCGCPCMYEVLAAEALRRSEAKLKEIAAAAERPTLPPDPATAAGAAGSPAASAPARTGSSGPTPAPGAEPGATSSPSEPGALGSSPSGSAGGASSPRSSDQADAPGLLWTFRCLDCGRTDLLPSVPAGWGDACPECGHAGVFLHRADQPAPPHASFADVIVHDGVLEEPGGAACYVCGGPVAQPGGKAARLRGGFVRAHLACCQEKRTKTARGVDPWIRFGDPRGYCHACKAPYRSGELTILGYKAHALYSLCQAGPTPPAQAPKGRMLGKAMKEPCVVCELEMVKGQTVTPHLDGTAHVLCVVVPEKPPVSFDGAAR